MNPRQETPERSTPGVAPRGCFGFVKTAGLAVKRTRITNPHTFQERIEHLLTNDARIVLRQLQTSLVLFVSLRRIAQTLASRGLWLHC